MSSNLRRAAATIQRRYDWLDQCIAEAHESRSDLGRLKTERKALRVALEAMDELRERRAGTFDDEAPS